MNSFLVTGGAGFIGSHVARALLDQGHRVRVLDNLSTGSRSNLEGLNKLEFLEGDIREEKVCNHACRGVDYVIHLAAMVSVPLSMEDPPATHHVNVTGTLNIFKAALGAQVKRVVYTSSSAVYGSSDSRGLSEEDAGGFLSPYALSKYVGELYAELFQSCFGLSCVGLRYFNVFGPRQDPASAYAAVIPKFISALVAGEAPIIHGDGGQTRDFVFIEDVVRANLLAAAAPLDRHQVFNIATGRATTITLLAELLAEILERDIRPVHGPERSGDIRDSLANIAKAKTAIGYEAIFSLRDGLAKTVPWFLRPKK